MKLVIITHVNHFKSANQYFAYGPYVKEMNLWFKGVDEVKVVAPISAVEPTPIDLAYQHQNLNIEKIPSFHLLNWNERIKSFKRIPHIIFKIYRAMRWADHIHLRCPGNVGLLGAIVQIAFPQKKKTVKYAGNWDPKSKQPWTYRLQKWIVSNTFLSRNIKVLVYGEWPNQSKNILHFFTASYSANEIYSINPKQLIEPLKLIYVGTLTANKRPLLCVETAKLLLEKGFKVQLEFYGEGPEKHAIINYILDYNLQDFVSLKGNVTNEILKSAYQKSHFLLLFSQSEGWPKAIAEAMFWGCLPVSTAVSCVPTMLDYGKRGSLVSPQANEIAESIIFYLQNENTYQEKVKNASQWSQQYTTDKMEREILELLKGN